MSEEHEAGLMALDDRLRTEPSDMSDAELNAAVAREVMGWRIAPQRGGARQRIWVTWPHDDPHDRMLLSDWSPASDIAVAVGDVVGEMRGREPHGWRFYLTDRDEMVCAAFVSGADRYSAVAEFGEEARAICIAALVAVWSETAR